uniref:Uncharacterized protein n=1 Tax=Anguilla anguilla TaxID=7936 RepID=A0A0E9PG56_ANGAN
MAQSNVECDSHKTVICNNLFTYGTHKFKPDISSFFHCVVKSGPSVALHFVSFAVR